MPGRGPVPPVVIAARRKRVEELYLRGTTQMDIAAELHCSQSTVSSDLDYWQKVWEKTTPLDIHKAKLRELARLDRVERTAWSAWERSCKDAETMHAETTRGRVDKDGSPLPDLVKTGKTVKGQAGDPRFLERVGWCIHERCQILGILKPEGSNTTVVTVVGGIDLAAVLGQKPGLSHDRIGTGPN